jgi:hypothetical protein
MSDESPKEEIKDEIHQFQDSEQEELEDDDEEDELEVDDEEDDFEDDEVGLTDHEEKNTSSENAT